MPRTARIVIPHIAHHITQRGNYQQIVFRNIKDHEKYCSLMNEYANKYRLQILAYCLMKNHVHFIVIPFDGESLSNVFKMVHMMYSQYYNKGNHIKGHLWQGRFYSCAMDETHLYRAIRYVERNPVHAGLVAKPWDYKWSSAKEHVGEERAAIGLSYNNQIENAARWKDYLMEEDVDMNEEIRLKTNRGSVIGEKEFIERMEVKYKRNLACKKPGRPKKRGLSLIKIRRKRLHSN